VGSGKSAKVTFKMAAVSAESDHEEIEVCLEAFETQELGCNLEFFKGNMRKYLKASYHAFKPPSDPCRVMLNVGINCGSIFKDESRLCLQEIIPDFP